MTLTDMLDDKAEYPGGGVSIPDALEVFKEWLRTISLYGPSPVIESTRKLLIRLVDEP